MVIKCQNKSMVKKIYIYDKMYSKYLLNQPDSFALTLYVCPKSTFLPSSALPSSPPSSLSSFLPVLGSLLLSFFPSLPCPSIWDSHCLWCPCSSWFSQHQTCQAWPWIGLFQSVFEGTEDSGKRRQCKRWLRSFISVLPSVVLFCCCLYTKRVWGCSWNLQRVKWQ